MCFTFLPSFLLAPSVGQLHTFGALMGLGSLLSQDSHCIYFLSDAFMSQMLLGQTPTPGLVSQFLFQKPYVEFS